MGIYNRPPAIAEDTLVYNLHVGSLSADLSAVSALATDIAFFVTSVLPDHIWHRDPFELKVTDIHGEWHLEGRMRTGDCVDDEWCVVWLMREISRRWDVAVSVYDFDGEFLLIEAAEHLPSWITPENSENRVWIYKNRLHIVPFNYTSISSAKSSRRRLINGNSDNEEEENTTMSGYISFFDGVRCVRDEEVDTLASQEVENVAFRRIQNYPMAAKQHIHRTKVYLPRDIALALYKNPFLVQKAIETFYTRDTIQMRAAARMVRFAPEPSVLATVKLTRTAYAQLMGQKFHPPRIFGEWKESEESPEWRRKMLGMKIACGFEMVYQESKNRNVPSQNSIAARKEALQRSPEYAQYIQKLQKADFFNGELQGSATWNDLEAKAILQFIEARQADNASRPSFASLVNKAISDAQKEGIRDFAQEEEESDEWLTVTESMMEDMFNQTRTLSTSLGADTMDVDIEDAKKMEDTSVRKQAAMLQKLASKVENFIEGKGDLGGAVFEDELSSGEDKGVSEFSDSDDDSDFEQEKCEGASAMMPAERQAAMAKLVPPLDPSEYGKMPPSFHTGSQDVIEDIPKYEHIQNEEERQEKVDGQNKEIPKQKFLRSLIFPQDEFDGVVDSDEDGVEDEDEDQPAVAGEIEIDMKEEEEDFLKFSREALGITPELWSAIVTDRKKRGAFLPKSAMKEHERKSKQRDLLMEAETSATEIKNKRPKLDSFEEVMQAMDVELARIKQERQSSNIQTENSLAIAKQNQGKQKSADSDEDDMHAMQAELDMDDYDAVEKGSLDYTLMKNFLESFKSQEGLSGPVSNLIGRLGGRLPRDNT